MKKRLARIEGNSLVADAVESERIRRFQQEFEAKHGGLGLKAYKAALADLNPGKLIWLCCPPDGAAFALFEASDQLLAAFCDGKTAGREEELVAELERLRLPADWQLGNPAGWVRAELAKMGRA